MLMRSWRLALLLLGVLAASFPLQVLSRTPVWRVEGVSPAETGLSASQRQLPWQPQTSSSNRATNNDAVPSSVSRVSRHLLQQRAASTPAAVASNSSEPEQGDGDWVQSLQDQPPAKSAAQATDADCPGCVSGFCSSTSQGFRCTSCLGSLFVSRADGSCGCPAGRYQPADQPNTCKDCEKGFFCAGGKYTEPGTPDRTACSTYSDGLTTLGLRSTSKKACVNQPGYQYVIDAVSGDPSAVGCPADTYGPGLRKQRACPSCPSGYTTFGRTKQTKIESCSVAAGYFMITPGRMAPCPRGTYKSSSDANCTSCGNRGVTTPAEASISEKNCTDVVSGLYAMSVVDGIVRATAKCPQRFFCPGGTARQAIDVNNVPANDPTIVKCPRSLWTQGLGSNTEMLCMTPPGHFTSATDTQPCPNGQYRPGWAPPDQASACLKCSPDGSIQSMAAEVMTVYKLDGTERTTMVKSSEKSCYIVGGQGLVAVDAANKIFRAVNCDTNNWGVADNTFGLNPNTVCKDCPTNLVTSKDPVTNPISSGYYKSDGSNPPRGGFVAAEACVSKPGWGVVKGVPAPCGVGLWSPGDTMDACFVCGYGLTTAPNSTQSSEADCRIAPGFGWLRNFVTPCPAVCRAGYGGDSCSACGGNTADYGKDLRPIGTPCVACPALGGADGGGGLGGYSFLDPKGGINWFSPRVIAAAAATQPSDCVAEFTQIAEDAWNLEPQLDVDWGSGAVTAETFADCTALCSYDTACQFVQFDYAKQGNNCRFKVAPAATSTSDLLCYKALPSTDVGASSIQPITAAATLTAAKAIRQLLSSNSSVRATAVVASGKYTIWRDPTASRIGRQTDPPQGVPLTYDACLGSCDADSECAGVFMTLQAINLKPLACKLIFGDKTANVFKRTVTRMVPDAQHMDMYTIVGFA